MGWRVKSRNSVDETEEEPARNCSCCEETILTLRITGGRTLYMAEPLSFQALSSRDYVLSSAEKFVLYVPLEAIARSDGNPCAGGDRIAMHIPTDAIDSIAQYLCTL